MGHPSDHRKIALTLMGIEITARLAGFDDVDVLVDLYAKLEWEMSALHPMWSRADGLDEPIEQSLREVLADASSRLYVGEVDGYPLGFIFGRSENLKEHEAPTRVALYDWSSSKKRREPSALEKP